MSDSGDVRTQRMPPRALAWLASAAIVPASLWGAAALWFQVPSPWRGLAAGAFLLLGGAALAARLPRRGAWRTAWVVALLALLAWWQTLVPSHGRDWADDVSQLLEARIDGDHVVLHNVRNFDWQDEADYVPRWETRAYDLSQLQSADLILSYWMGPMIAHTLVSFGFSDGRRLVFSLEIRKEREEAFSAVAGFFKRYERVIIAADEADIVRVRSNVRGEDVYLYRLAATPGQLRTVFLGYLEAAAALRREPRFYDTLTANCTTIIFELARQLAPGLPLDYRLLLSGYFAEYAYDHGGLVTGHDFATLRRAGRVTDRARAADTGNEDFSHAIRRGIPGAQQPGTNP